jgi:hypothetical protein
MFKLLFGMIFWGAIAVAIAYGYATFSEDYELQNRISFFFEDINMHKDVIAQEVRDMVDGAKQSANDAKQNLSPAGVARSIDLKGIAGSIKIPTKAN